MDAKAGAVTDRVFEAFLKELEVVGVDEPTRARLGKTLLVERKLNEPALRAAVFGGEEIAL